MNTSRTNGNGRLNGVNGNGRYRRNHRWAGATLVAFVLFLSITGIALNHSGDLGLDRRYVSWSWLLEAYGMAAPEPYAGKTSVGELVVVGDGKRAHLLLASGELVESLDLGSLLPGAIERVGRAADRAVLQSDGVLFRSDAEITTFEPWAAGDVVSIDWSAEVQPDAPGLEAIDAAWRGHGLTIERVLLDLHSGRVLSLGGRLLLDVIAIGLIALSISGLVLARRRNGNGRS